MDHSRSGCGRREARARGALLLAVGIGLAAALSRTETVDATETASRTLVPCHLERLAEEVLCGEHEVFENREAGSGRRLKIRFAVLEPLRRGSEPDPLFVLAAGPGQGARSFSPIATRFFEKVRRSGGPVRLSWWTCGARVGRTRSSA